MNWNVLSSGGALEHDDGDAREDVSETVSYNL